MKTLLALALLFSGCTYADQSSRKFRPHDGPEPQSISCSKDPTCVDDSGMTDPYSHKVAVLAWLKPLRVTETRSIARGF